jgi:hypothetical protein
MTIDPNLGAAAPALIDRVKNILLTPQAEWDRIAAETPTLGSMLVGYVAPLAAVAVAAGIVGTLVFTGFAVGVGGFLSMLVGGAISVAIAMGFVAVWGILINALAPTFGSEKNPLRAYQLSVYSSTATFVAAVASIIPLLSLAASLAGMIYAFVLVYVGLPRLLKTPEDKRMPFVLTLVAIALVAGLVISGLYASMYLPMMMRRGYY